MFFKTVKTGSELVVKGIDCYWGMWSKGAIVNQDFFYINYLFIDWLIDIYFHLQ